MSTPWILNPLVLTQLRTLKLNTFVSYWEDAESSDSWEFSLITVAHFVTASIENLSLILDIRTPRSSNLQEVIPVLHKLDWERLGKSLRQYHRLKDASLEIATSGVRSTHMKRMQKCMGDVSRRLFPESEQNGTVPWRYQWRRSGARSNVTVVVPYNGSG